MPQPSQKISKLALISFISALFGVLLYVVVGPVLLKIINYPPAILFLLVALILGILAIRQIKRNKELLKGYLLAKIAVAVSFIFLFFIFPIIILFLIFAIPVKLILNPKRKTKGIGFILLGIILLVIAFLIRLIPNLHRFLSY